MNSKFNSKKVLNYSIDLTESFSSIGLYLFLFYKHTFIGDDVSDNDYIKDFIEHIFSSSGVDFATLLTSYYCYLDLLKRNKL